MGQSKSKQSGSTLRKDKSKPPEEKSPQKNGNSYVPQLTGQTAYRPPPDSPVTPAPAPNTVSNSDIQKAIAEGIYES